MILSAEIRTPLVAGALGVLVLLADVASGERASSSSRQSCAWGANWRPWRARVRCGASCAGTRNWSIG